MIHYKDSKGDELFFEYDEVGHKIHEKHSNGYEKWFEYDHNGNEVLSYDSNNNKKIKIYNNDNNLIYEKCIDTEKIVETWYEYNSEKKCSHSKTVSGDFEFESDFIYNENSRYEIDKNGSILISKFDENNNLIYSESKYIKSIYEYDEYQNKKYEKIDEKEIWYVNNYDSQGNLIHCIKYKSIEKE